MIRPQEHYQRFLDLLGEEEQRFLAPGSNAVLPALGDIPVRCVACASPFTGTPSQGYISCATCGTLNSYPRLRKEFLRELWQPNSAADFFHEHVYSAGAASRKERMSSRVAELQKYLQKGRVIEAGCSIGLFLDLLVEAGFEAEGAEIIPHSIRRCRENAHTIHPVLLEDAHLQSGVYDAVVAWEVICHVADPLHFFRKAAGFLKEGGLLFLSTPNSLGLEYDTIWEDGLRHHANLKPHVFLQIFSTTGISTLLDRAGLSVVEMKTPGTMDIKNLREIAFTKRLRFSTLFLNNLLLHDEPASEHARVSFQKFLTSSGYSGHSHLVAQKVQQAESTE